MLLSLFLSLAFAALPSKTQVQLSAKEILSMPEKNREQVATTEKNKKKLYQDLSSIAFDSRENMDLRWKALTLSSLVGGKDSIPMLIKATQSEEWYMRNAGLLALARVSPSQANKYAKLLLDDRAMVVRSAAVKVLGQKMNAENRDLLWEQLESKNNFRNKQSLWIRSQIIELLAINPDKKEKPLFTKLVKDKDLRFKLHVTSALEKIEKNK